MTARPGASYGYAYDLAGNRTDATVNHSVSESRSYNEADQVVAWTYDTPAI